MVTPLESKERERLLDAVFHGEMKPDDAEDEARRLGLRPLRDVPDPARFDPMTKPVWTLAMAISWISWRNVDAVRDAWDEYRGQCWEWRKHQTKLPSGGGRGPGVYQGWALSPRYPATLNYLSTSEACDRVEGNAPVLSVRDARAALWEALAGNQIVATAVECTSGRPLQIPSEEWTYLVPLVSNGLADQLCFETRPGIAQYRDVTFGSADLRRLWSAPEMKPAVPGRSSPPGSYPHTLDVNAIKSRPFLYLGEVVEWIICRGGTVDSFEVAAKRDDAERELFDHLDKEKPEVWGYPAPNLPRIYERMPSGIWARMNRGKSDDPTFSPIDDSECREDGGSIAVGRQRWDGVRISTGLVLEKWPMAITPGDNAGPRSKPPRKRYDPAQLVAYLEEQAQKWKDDKGPRITGRGWRKVVGPERFPGVSTTQCDEAWGAATLPPGWREGGRPKKA